MTRQENSVGIKGEVHHRWCIKSTSSDALRGTFLAMAVRVAIEKWLGGVSADAIKSMIEKNVGAETIWEMIPQRFKQSMFVYSNEHPNQLRYVLNPVWVVEAIREANPPLAEYFTDFSLGRVWLDSILWGIRSKSGV